MIRTIIVDDEPWVCKVIETLVDWKNLGFEVLGEAHDGKDALQMILEQKPDLVLTDIRMAGMDGLTLIQNIRSAGLNMEFIVISGHSDFEYAKEALKYGVLGYLLKPIEKDEILFYLNKMITDRQRVVAEHHAKERLREQLQESKKLLQEGYFRQLMAGGFTGIETDLSVLNQQYACHFQPGMIRAVIYHLDYPSNFENTEYDSEQSMLQLKKYLTEKYSSKVYEHIIVFEGYDLLQILNYAEEEQENVERYLQRSVGDIQGAFVLNLCFRVTVGVGTQVFGLHRLEESYQLAQSCIESRIHHGINRVIETSVFEQYSNDRIDDIFSPETRNLIKYKLNSHDYQDLAVILSVFYQRLELDRTISPVIIFKASREIIKIFISYAEDHYRYRENLQELCADKKELMKQCFQISQIRELFLQLLKSFGEWELESSSKKNDHIILIAKRYISEHYREEIMLADIADKVGLNPRYFGEMFKKEVGIGYNEYLTNFRIDAAKELLKDTRIKTKEIGAMVGYKDMKYFGKLFKKETGLSLMEYRKVFT